ncbi:pimeloyl-ACP methyl ester carboxylesterase [Bradyrhizobium sp. USDA 328]
MGEPTQRTIKANGISLNVAEQGEGPMVLLCHGFPEGWYSWRHQLEALAAAGYHAVAPDMRGYGKSDRPEAIDQYTILHMVGDLVGVLDAFEAKDAVIVGHDWGATIAWHTARLRPDRFRAAAILSVPYRPRSPVRPTSVMPRRRMRSSISCTSRSRVSPKRSSNGILAQRSVPCSLAVPAKEPRRSVPMPSVRGGPLASAWSRGRTECCRRCRCRCRRG